MKGIVKVTAAFAICNLFWLTPKEIIGNAHLLKNDNHRHTLKITAKEKNNICLLYAGISSIALSFICFIAVKHTATKDSHIGGE